MGPFSLFGSRLDSGACCQPVVHDRRARLWYQISSALENRLVKRACLLFAYSSLSTSSPGSDAERSIMGSERSRTM